MSRSDETPSPAGQTADADGGMPVLWRDRRNAGNGTAVGAYRGGGGAPSTEKPKVSFWWPMRGRWWVAGLTTLVAALLAGLIGWSLSTVRYEATGRIETRLLQTGPAGQPLPTTDDAAGVLEREAALLRGLAERERSIGIDVTPPTGLTVVASATSANAANSIAQQLLEQYASQSRLPAEVESASKAGVLLTQLEQLRTRRDDTLKRIDQLAWDDQGASLTARLDAAQRSLTQRQTKLDQIERWLQQSESLAVSRQTAMVVLAETDPAFAELLIERTDLLVELVSMLHGKSDQPATELRDRWVELQAKIDAMADDTAVMPASWVGAPQDEQRLVAVRRSALRDQRAEVRGEVEQLRQTVADLGARHRQLQDEQATLRDLNREVQTAEEAYALIERPAVVLKLEEARVTNAAETPTLDNRAEVIPASAAGGALLGFLGVLIWAFADNRWRRADPEPWTTRDAPLVGVVPDVNTKPDGDAAPTEAQSRTMRRDLSRLADAVHAIRAVVEAQLRDDAAQTICIASASKASGKTSLTVGLASSLVMGGMRVLVVDASLTDRTARPRTGPSLDADPEAGQSLDEVMIGMDYLDAEDRDLLAFPDGETIGLGAYLRGAPLEAAIIRTRVQGLALLSGVGVQPGDAGRMSRAFLQQMAMEAREHYDAVLFDTGSIPRCVEALFVAGACNGVLLVVGHGEKRRHIDHALERLRLVGARVIGTVFNRDRAKPDAAGDFDSGGTIDPSWRDQGSGMFAAAIRTHGGQPGKYDAPKGQTGMFRGVEPETTSPQASTHASDARPPEKSPGKTQAGPIDFAAPPRPKAKRDKTTKPAEQEKKPDTANVLEDSGDLIDGIDMDALHDDAPDPANATWAGDHPAEQHLAVEDGPGDGVIDEYIDSVLNAASEGKPTKPTNPEPKQNDT